MNTIIPNIYFDKPLIHKYLSFFLNESNDIIASEGREDGSFEYILNIKSNNQDRLESLKSDYGRFITLILGQQDLDKNLLLKLMSVDIRTEYKSQFSFKDRLFYYLSRTHLGPTKEAIQIVSNYRQRSIKQFRDIIEHALTSLDTYKWSKKKKRPPNQALKLTE
jgi:hypothetical protein